MTFGPLVNSLLNYLTRTYIRTLGLPITRLLNLWKGTSVALLLHHGSAKVYSPIMAPNTWIFIPKTQKDLKCVFFYSQETLGQKETQSLGKILFTVYIFRGGSVLCPC